ncbi:uncharacterized protein HD556DRAFT_1313310 [Suillus plorans]|uniref:Uncharacterized protein n=1 Tax=Suillus plorans TaxID=116603 RepID=A0A9P7AEB4_9AGAM|nr:uncharacterized protein HD556DRAFT_1313310 [Suillus plorans]KAG1786688.1 hypothetical protein HD556DRAFT_1313310 [Suillus plorans]
MKVSQIVFLAILVGSNVASAATVPTISSRQVQWTCVDTCQSTPPTDCKKPKKPTNIETWLRHYGCQNIRDTVAMGIVEWLDLNTNDSMRLAKDTNFIIRAAHILGIKLSPIEKASDEHFLLHNFAHIAQSNFLSSPDAMKVAQIVALTILVGSNVASAATVPTISSRQWDYCDGPCISKPPSNSKRLSYRWNPTYWLSCNNIIRT